MITEFARLRQAEVAEVRRLLVDDPDQALEYVEERDADWSDDIPVATRRRLDVDKAWAAIRHLLERAGPPPVDIIGGGSRLSEHEWGYDAPRLLLPGEVAAAAAFLAATPFDRLAAVYDATDLRAAAVYPEVWGSDDDLEYLAGWYEPLVEFFIAAAAEGDSVLVWLT